MNESLLSFSCKENPFSRATKAFSSPGSHAFTIRFDPRNWSSKRVPSGARASVLEPSEEIDVTKNKEVRPRLADSKTLVKDSGEECSGGVRIVGVVVMHNGALSEPTTIDSDSVWGVRKNRVKRRRFESWK